nr:hypothetical protein CFP56_04630 [Quercus suber]
MSGGIHSRCLMNHNKNSCTCHRVETARIRLGTSTFHGSCRSHAPTTAISVPERGNFCAAKECQSLLNKGRLDADIVQRRVTCGKAVNRAKSGCHSLEHVATAVHALRENGMCDLYITVCERVVQTKSNAQVIMVRVIGKVASNRTYKEQVCDLVHRSLSSSSALIYTQSSHTSSARGSLARPRGFTGRSLWWYIYPQKFPLPSFGTQYRYVTPLLMFLGTLVWHGRGKQQQMSSIIIWIRQATGSGPGNLASRVASRSQA